MEFVNDFLGFVEATFLAIWHFIAALIYWALAQIAAIPWGHLNYLPAWKIMLLSAVMAVWFAFIYRMIWAFWEAGEKAITAVIILTTVFIRSLPIIVAAGILGAAGTWIINCSGWRSGLAPSAFASPHHHPRPYAAKCAAQRCIS